MTPQELKNSILQLAVQGKLVEQRSEEGNAEELYQQIQEEKRRLIKAGRMKKEKPLPEITEDEILFEIPEGWKWVRVRECISNRAGLAYDKTNLDVKSSNMVRVLRGGNILDMGYTVKPDDVMISSEFVKMELLLHRNTIITPAVTSLDHVGKMGRIEKDYVDMVVGGFVLMLMPHMNNDTFSKYLMYAFSSKYFRDCCRKNVNKSGQAFYNISREKMMALTIPLPPLAEQRRITARIEELLPYIDRYEQAWSRLEAFNKRFPDDMKKSILQLAIQGKLVEQRTEEGTGEELYQKIQEEKRRLIKTGIIKKEKPLSEITEDEIPFEIPGSWKWVSVGSVCTNIQYGSSQKSSHTGKIAVLRMGNIQDGKLVLDKLVYTSDDKEISKYPLQHNDLLFNRTNSKELVGKTAIYKSEIPAIYAGYLVRITPVLADSDYLNYVMQSQYYWGYCQRVRSDAIGQSNINAGKLRKFAFPLPPLAEQKRIVARLEELLPLCERLK